MTIKKINFILLIICLHHVTSSGQNNEFTSKNNEEKTIEIYLKNGAWNHHYLSKEWEEWVDKGIQQDSAIAYLWQQKALPYWKLKKFESAIRYYNKAVKYDRQTWLSRLGFLKCIFAKDYSGALIDLKTYVNEFGTTYEQDHPLEFYMGICYLQLNNYDEALEIFKNNIDIQIQKSGKKWVHHLDRFYLGIAYFEKNNYVLSLEQFDELLSEYPDFSDAQFYKSLCLFYLGEKENAEKVMNYGKNNFNKGITFNEDSNLYEIYPYQVTWQWKFSDILLKQNK